MRRWSWCFAILALGALAGCGSSSRHIATPPAPSTTAPTIAPGTNPTTATTATSPTTGSGSTSPTSDASQPAVTTVPGPQRCSSSQLSGSLGQENGTAGTIYYPLVLTNKSGSTCYVEGYPGVSFVAGSDGHQVGAAATREPGTVQKITLAPGQAAAATLGIVDATNYGPPCQITSVLGLRVYPPNEVAALFVPHQDRGCANSQDVTLKVNPLVAA